MLSRFSYFHKLNHQKIVSLALIGLTLALLFSSCSSGVPTEQARSIVLADCQLSMPGSSIRLDAQCGKLKVYEDRSTSSGRQIELNIAIIPAVSRSPSPDPLFFLAGGPGEAATQSYIAVASAFSSIRAKRDIVLVDQRGTGKSHPLECRNSSQSNAQSDESAFLKDCLSQLNADPRLYTTTIAMQDLDQVRDALGYEKINIYGASYGTRAALVYLRMYPERVRTIILDGAAPPNWTLGPSVAGDAQRAMNLIFNRCKSEPACQNAFPDLSTEFDALLGNLASQSVEVELDDPVSGEPTKVTLDYESFSSTLHTMSYTPETAALLPLALHTAYVRNDFRSITAQTLSASHLLYSSISFGMRLSVICAEDIPFAETIPTSEGYMQEFFTKSFTQLCRTWPRGDIPADFKDPVSSDVPVLIISGEADPVTPPSNGDLAAKTLSSSLHLVVPGMGHINIFRGCIPKIASNFIEAGTISGLDVACVQDIAPMPFFINFSGPNP
jgi:pimeloyl-ACP methyl ester carboxylesterase